MHEFRIPTDFDIHVTQNGIHLASGKTAAFWFGLILVIGMTLNLALGLIRGGRFESGWGISKPDRDNPVTSWLMVLIEIAILAAGLDAVITIGFGIKPWLIG
jgi:hypothetical protein